MRRAEKSPATVTEAVPWISSLKQQTVSRYFCSRWKAFLLAKSSNWIMQPGKDLLHRHDEFLDQFIVFLAAHPWLFQANVERIIQQYLDCWCRRRW